MAGDQADHPAPARPHDQDLDLPGSHWLTPALRHRLDHDSGRARERVADSAHILVFQRCRAHAVRLRCHDLCGPIRHLLRIRAGLPAIRAAPRYRRCPDEGSPVTEPKRLMAPRRLAASTVILLVLAITLAPMLYLILSGFRT